MSHPLKNAVRLGLWNAVCTLLLSFSLSLLWSRLLTGEGQVLFLLGECAAAAFGLSAIDRIFRGKWKALVYAVLLISQGALAFFGKGLLYPLIQALKAETLHVLLNDPLSSVYHSSLRTAIVLLMSVFMFTGVWDDTCFTGLFLFAALVFFCFVFRQYETLPVYTFTVEAGIRMLLPGICGCLMTLSAAGGKKLSAVPLALLLTAAAFFLFPSSVPQNSALKEAAQSIADYGPALIPLPASGDRDSFSMAAAGYQPMEDRLGGSVRPGSGQVMRVTGDKSAVIHLRAKACNTYTGLAWYDTLSGTGALFDGFAEDTKKSTLFPSAGRNLGQEHTLKVTMLNNDTTTVYAPLRLNEWKGLSGRMVLYYAPSSELYLTRNLTAGDSYEMTWYPEDQLISFDDEVVWEFVTEHYLTVPQHMQQEVRDICIEASGRYSEPLDKAEALRSWLRSHCRYSLQVEDPPENVDSVSYFLLGSREGYCTYFASAMTILCRMAGIPARYVTGYLVTTDADGTAVVTQKNAHAWTEIYLKNIGWITMDATPGEGMGNGNASGKTPTPAPDSRSGGTPSPAPENTGRETNTPSPSTSPTATPTKASAPTDSRPPEQKPSDPPGTGEKEKEPDHSGNMILLLIAAALSAVAGLIAYRIVSRDPDRMAAAAPEKAAELYYEAGLQLLDLRHLRKRRTETWNEYGRRLSDLPGMEGSQEACEELSAAFYGREPALDRHRAETLYRSVKAHTGKGIRMRFRIVRAFSAKSRCFLK